MPEEQVRYRSVQINIVKIDGAISAHATIKAEHLLTVSGPPCALCPTVELLDSVYDFHTKGSEQAAELVRATDRVKRRLVYQLNDRGIPVKLLNHDEVLQNWRDFQAELPSSGLRASMDDATLRRFVAVGDAEYTSEEVLLKNSGTALFNKIVFGQYLTRDADRFEVETFETQSHFFPQVRFDVHCKTERQGEEETMVHYSKSGRPLFVDKSQMVALYEQLYRAQIGFKFTDYLYDYESNFSVSKRERLVQKAEVAIRERIKNNLESDVLYKLRTVEL